MRVLIADDQPRVRYALRVALERQPGHKKVEEAIDTGDVLLQARCACPDLLLLDLDLPGVPTADLLGELRPLCNHLRVIVLSERPEMAQAALAVGADAFVSKADPPERLLSAIHQYWVPA